MYRKTAIITLCLAILGGGACSVKPEKIMEGVVGSMCKRVVVCQQGLFPDEETCRSKMQEALGAAKSLESVKASQKQLDACLSSIGKVECEKLLGTEPPAGCEFLN